MCLLHAKFFLGSSEKKVKKVKKKCV